MDGWKKWGVGVLVVVLAFMLSSVWGTVAAVLLIAWFLMEHLDVM